MSALKTNLWLKRASWAMVFIICFVLTGVGYLVLGSAFTLVGLLAAVASIALPALAALVLVWFFYALFLRRYFRLRRIRHMRNLRAWREAAARRP